MEVARTSFGPKGGLLGIVRRAVPEPWKKGVDGAVRERKLV